MAAAANSDFWILTSDFCPFSCPSRRPPGNQYASDDEVRWKVQKVRLVFGGSGSMIRNTLARIHRDEQGIEALQAVMVMAVAAVVLALVKTQWPSVKTYFTTKVANIT